MVSVNDICLRLFGIKSDIQSLSYSIDSLSIELGSLSNSLSLSSAPPVPLSFDAVSARNCADNANRELLAAIRGIEQAIANLEK